MAIRLPDWRLVSGGFSGAAGGSGIPFREIPKGTLDGSNKTFTISFTPWLGYVWLELNGVEQDPLNGPEFTISGKTITYAVAPKSTDNHWCWYFKGPGSPVLPSTGIARAFGIGGGGSTDVVDWGYLPTVISGIVGDMTFACWVRTGTQASAGDDAGPVLAYQGSPTTADVFEVHMKYSSGTLTMTWEHEYGGGFTAQQFTFSYVFQPNTWYFVCLVRDSTALTVKLYVGTASVVSLADTYSYSRNADAGDSSSHLTIGNRPQADSPLGGAVQQHYLWGRTLSDIELNLAMAGSPPASKLLLACTMGNTPEVDISSTGASGAVTGTILVAGH